MEEVRSILALLCLSFEEANIGFLGLISNAQSMLICCSWRKNKACEVNHTESTTSIECHLIKSGMCSQYLAEVCWVRGRRSLVWLLFSGYISCCFLVLWAY